MPSKQRELDSIAEEIERCKVCKVGKIGVAVPGEGDPNARVMFVGEAPGREEAKTGRPFIGRSGKLLRSLIQDSGLKDDEVYITSPVKYLPKSGTPTRTEILHGKKHLDKQVAVIGPKVVVLLGSVACKALLDEPVSVTQTHGTVIEKEGIRYFITLHPAAGLRFPPLKKVLIQDFKKLKKLL